MPKNIRWIFLKSSIVSLFVGRGNNNAPKKWQTIFYSLKMSFLKHFCESERRSLQTMTLAIFVFKMKISNSQIKIPTSKAQEILHGLNEVTVACKRPKLLVNVTNYL